MGIKRSTEVFFVVSVVLLVSLQYKSIFFFSSGENQIQMEQSQSARHYPFHYRYMSCVYVIKIHVIGVNSCNGFGGLSGIRAHDTNRFR